MYTNSAYPKKKKTPGQGMHAFHNAGSPISFIGKLGGENVAG